MSVQRRILPQLLISALLCGLLTSAAANADRQAAQKGLEPFNSLIGEWRGVGQPRRGSSRGAWKQTGEWVWSFMGESPSIQYRVADGKLVEEGRLTFDAEAELYQFELTTPEAQTRRYQGEMKDGKLTLEAPPDEEGVVHRMTVTLLNDKRTLVLHETRKANQQRFFRVAEVGYTRKGVRLARPGGGQPECIVTGGAGTTEVTHKGKTYYVCCSGCKQAFEDDPEGIIAEAAERRKQEQSKKN